MKDHEFNTDLRVSPFSSRISPVVIMAPSERATQRMQQERTFRTDLVAITLLIVTVFLLLSLGTYHPSDPPTSLVFPARTAPMNLCGIYGSTAAQTMVHLFGFGAYILVGSMGIATVMLFARIGLEDSGLRITGWFMSFCACCVLLSMTAPHLGSGYLPPIGSGGLLGTVGLTLTDQLSPLGIGLTLGSLLLVGLTLVLDQWMIQLILSPVRVPFQFLSTVKQRNAYRTAQDTQDILAQNEYVSTGESSQTKWEAAPDGEDTSLNVDLFVEEDKASIDPESTGSSDAHPSAPIPVNTPSRVRKKREQEAEKEVVAVLDAATEKPTETEHVLPSLELLATRDTFPYEEHEQTVRKKAQILEQTFEDFGYDVKVVEIDTGPVITQYEIELEAGLRLSKIMGLSDDLAIKLRVPSVRIVAPIPGKNTVGIEIPNEKRVLVRLKEVIEDAENEADTMRIPLFLGKNVSGKSVVCDLADMPHLLIAGRTGTGKSVCLNSIILSILMTRDPDQVRLLMVDPKMVELAPYRQIPHLMHPVVTDMKKAEAILSWAVDKMEERYELLARTGVRHVDSYNNLDPETIAAKLGPMDEDESARIPNKMPYIVIIGDEIADLMMTSPKEVESHIIRLAQKSRAVGIHLVLATQKPTVDVITGLIKSNLPARICFQVASRTDSRVVLDEIGAEKLLAQGDMLYLLPGTSTMVRAQGTFVGDAEVHDTVSFLSTNKPSYFAELVKLKPKEEAADNQIPSRRDDPLFGGAVEVVLREGRGSVSLLQRTLGIGYGRAARLIDYMAEDGIVGDYNGSQAREVLLTTEEWHSMNEYNTEETDVHNSSPTDSEGDESYEYESPAESPAESTADNREEDTYEYESEEEEEEEEEEEVLH